MITCDREAPYTFAVAFERVKPPSRKRRQFSNILSLLDGGKHRAKLFCMLPCDTAHLITSPEPLEVPVAKAGNAHCATYAITVHVSIDIEPHIPSGPRAIATMPVRDTSTRPSGSIRLMNWSTFSEPPVISNTKLSVVASVTRPWHPLR